MRLRRRCAARDPSTRVRKKIAIAVKIQSSTRRGQRSRAISGSFPPLFMFFPAIPSEEVRIGAVIFADADLSASLYNDEGMTLVDNLPTRNHLLMEEIVHEFDRAIFRVRPATFEKPRIVKDNNPARDNKATP